MSQIKLTPGTVAARPIAWGRLPFGFAPRFYVTLLAGLVWLGPAWWDQRFAWLTLAWDVLALVAWTLDLRHLPLPAELKVWRTWLAPPSQGVNTEVEVTMESSARAQVIAHCTDDLPSVLALSLPQFEIRGGTSGLARAKYGIHPRVRGDVGVGKLFLRVQSPMRFAERWMAAPLEQTVRVYPNLHEAKQHALYLIRRQQIEQERRLKCQPGRGREFESLRAYHEGDEPRDICWTATARCGKAITRVYRVERSQPVVIVVDSGRLMLTEIRRGPDKLTKLDYAVNSALALANVAFYSGDRVGLLAYGRKPKVRLLPGRSSRHFRSLMDQLSLLGGELLEANHDAAADTLLSLKSQRMLVVWLTDLVETPSTPAVIEAASRLLPHHLVLFVAIGQADLDELLAEAPADANAMYRHAAAQEMVQRRELLIRRLRAQGAMVLDLQPQQLSTAVVNQYLMVKERGML